MPNIIVVLAIALQGISAPGTLPPEAAAKLHASLKSAAAHKHHVWRDTPPFDLSRRSSPPDSRAEADGVLVNAYIEIPLGGRQKFELDMAKNAPAIDRLIPEKIGGYPVNYGIVPQTVSYDGDPFDVLVLGPPIDGGRVVRGVIVGVMRMQDEKGLDSKVVISRTGPDRRPLHALTAEEQQRIGDYFRRYKAHEEGKFSKVPGWGSVAEGLSYVTTTHTFFVSCRVAAESSCTLPTTPSTR